jgi:hypothetical protein
LLVNFKPTAVALEGNAKGSNVAATSVQKIQILPYKQTSLNVSLSINAAEKEVTAPLM